MLERILSTTLGAFAVGAIGVNRSLRHAKVTARVAGWTKYLVFLALVHGVILAALSPFHFSAHCLAWAPSRFHGLLVIAESCRSSRSCFLPLACSASSGAKLAE